MSRRRFTSAPDRILETMLRMRCLRWMWAEVRLELCLRGIEKLASTGPWLCAPPDGMV